MALFQFFPPRTTLPTAHRHFVHRQNFGRKRGETASITARLRSQYNVRVPIIAAQFSSWRLTTIMWLADDSWIVRIWGAALPTARKSFCSVQIENCGLASVTRPLNSNKHTKNSTAIIGVKPVNAIDSSVSSGKRFTRCV